MCFEAGWNLFRHYSFFGWPTIVLPLLRNDSICTKNKTQRMKMKCALRGRSARIPKVSVGVVYRTCQVMMLSSPTSQKQRCGERKVRWPSGEGPERWVLSRLLLQAKNLELGENSFLVSLGTPWVSAMCPYSRERCVYSGHQVPFPFVKCCQCWCPQNTWDVLFWGSSPDMC